MKVRVQKAWDEKSVLNVSKLRPIHGYFYTILSLIMYIYRPPVALSPRTIPTPMMWPITPQARVSVAVKPAGSPVWRPESLSTSFNPDKAFLLADGARPNRPANSIKVVEATMICRKSGHIESDNRLSYSEEPSVLQQDINHIPHCLLGDKTLQAHFLPLSDEGKHLPSWWMIQCSHIVHPMHPFRSQTWAAWPAEREQYIKKTKFCLHFTLRTHDIKLSKTVQMRADWSRQRLHSTARNSSESGKEKAPLFDHLLLPGDGTERSRRNSPHFEPCRSWWWPWDRRTRGRARPPRRKRRR